MRGTCISLPEEPDSICLSPVFIPILNFFQLAASTTNYTYKEKSSMPIPNPCTCGSLHNEGAMGTHTKRNPVHRPLTDLSWTYTSHGPRQQATSQASDIPTARHRNSPQASASHPESSCCTFLSTIWPTNVDQLKQARLLPAMGMRRLSHLIFDAGSDHIIRRHCERDVSSYNPEPHITII